MAKGQFGRANDMRFLAIVRAIFLLFHCPEE